MISGIASAQCIDSSGEVLILDGLDISSLVTQGVLNYEHKSDQPSQIVGKILFAKKIFKQEDAESPDMQKFWNRVKCPFLYIIGELFDDVGHQSSEDIAAMLRYDKRMRDKGVIGNNGVKPLVNFSVEGGKLEMDGSIIKKSIARKVSVTILACNKVCEAEIYEGEAEKQAAAPAPTPEHDAARQKARTLFENPKYAVRKSESMSLTKSEGGPKPLGTTKTGKSVMAQHAGTYPGWSAADHKEAANMHYDAFGAAQGADKQHHMRQVNFHMRMANTTEGRMPKPAAAPSAGPNFAKPSVKRLYTDIPGSKRGVAKSLSAGSYNAAPGSLQGGAALQSGKVEPKMYKSELLQKNEETAEQAWRMWKKAEQFRSWVSQTMPTLNTNETESLGRLIRLRSWAQAEKKADELLG